MNKIYAINHYSFIDRIVIKKRKEMSEIINKELSNSIIHDALDIGTTNDLENKSSNYLIKHLKNIKVYKSISDQKIDDNFFSEFLKKSITEKFTYNEIQKMKSDLVISNAVIEHVGSFDKQKQMIKNILLLTKKYFIITTPNKYHPLEFHTKLPILHWFPKKIYMTLLKLLRIKFFSKEENLNLLSKNDLIKLFASIEINNFIIHNIFLFGFKSNFIVIGKVIS